jgi:hypothetical protein
MTRTAIESLRKLAGKSKKVLGGLVRVGVGELAELVLAIRAVGRLIEELADHGTERLANPAACLLGLKPRGKVFSPDQLDALERWLDNIKSTHSTFGQQLERIVSGSSWDRVAREVQKVVTEQPALAREFSNTQRGLWRGTLSLHHIEQQFSKFFHKQRGVRLCLEEIKELLLTAPVLFEWTRLHEDDPEGLRRFREAEELMRAGRREEGEQRLFDLLRWRGAGTLVFARHYALRKLVEGNLAAATAILQRASEGIPVPHEVAAALATLSLRRPQPGPVWRSLPRGFVIAGKYRVEEEVARGDRSSVYRVHGAGSLTPDWVFALKVPAPEIVADEATAERLEKEIERARQRAEEAREAPVRLLIDLTVDGVRFEDPATGRRLIGQVRAWRPDISLAWHLAYRRASRQPFTAEEIHGLMASLCAALESARALGLPVLRPDTTPGDVMVTEGGQAVLLDGTLSRALEDRPGKEPLDVHTAGRLLRELLAVSPAGEADEWMGCREAWAELSADATDTARGRQPRTLREFLDRLAGEPRRVSPTPVPALPAPRQSPNGRPLVVDASGGGDCRTIEEAIDRAARGTCIRIRQGVYREGIRLFHPFELVGEGPRAFVVVENDAGPALLLRADGAVVRGLTLRCTAVGKGETVFGVDIAAGHSVLEDCDIRSASLSCVGIHGRLTAPLVRRCSVFDGASAGIFVYDGASGTFVRSRAATSAATPSRASSSSGTATPTPATAGCATTPSAASWCGNRGLARSRTATSATTAIPASTSRRAATRPSAAVALTATSTTRFP